jgi:hypothetical protein
MVYLLSDEQDIKQINARGIKPEGVKSQIETLQKGFPFAKLERPCIVGDGIQSIQKSDFQRLINKYLQAASYGRAMKFVPASGAASRMFKLLLSYNNRYNEIDEKYISAEADKGDSEGRTVLQFMREIKRFAFYDDLKSVMAKEWLDIEVLISEGQYKRILEYMLNPNGLNYADFPKGLINFHRYPNSSRTPFEEHLVEGAAYVLDKNRIARVHFTVPAEHEERIKEHIEELKTYYESSAIRYEITLSTQKPSTDTIAVDLDNKPFRDKDGRLVFRPAGHGALLENLNDLRADIVFIKNIDNVVPDRLKHETHIYKKALGGYLVELQEEIFGYLQMQSRNDVDEQLLKQMFDFARCELSITPPEAIKKASREEKIKFLFSKLNRPLRVCGMVKNEGEPGGGPFWVKHVDNTFSLQIVESSQVDMKSTEQSAIWESSTHFNPVDLVCGVRDYQGSPFDLSNFSDPDTGFISIKSMDGKELKALELPGLWNGAMAKWNTVFIEVPIITFNPVKTVLDLLREEHQPE